jgi:hypothetical protein
VVDEGKEERSKGNREDAIAEDAYWLKEGDLSFQQFGIEGDYKGTYPNHNEDSGKH